MKKEYFLLCLLGLSLSGCKNEPGSSLSGISKEIFSYAKTIEDDSLKSEIELTNAIVFCKDEMHRIILSYNIFYDNGSKGSNIVVVTKKKDDDEVDFDDYSKHSSGTLQAQFDEINFENMLSDAKILMLEVGDYITYEEYEEFHDGVLQTDVEEINVELVEYQKSNRSS